MFVCLVYTEKILYIYAWKMDDFSQKHQHVPNKRNEWHIDSFLFTFSR